MEFSTAVARWQNFQLLAGTVAATLLGLLFVAVSIRPALFKRETHPDFLSIGSKSMGLFVLVILMALVFQVPDIHPESMALWLILMAVISLFNTAYQVVTVRRILHEWGVSFLLRRVLLPATGYAALLFVSTSVYRGSTEQLHLLALIEALFLFTATYNAWDLLIRVGSS